MRAEHLEWMPTVNAGARSIRSGAELFYAFLGAHDRFCVAECYQRPVNGAAAPTLYVVKDADRVTDAEVRAGRSSPVVFRSPNAQECVDWALQQR